MSVRAIVLTGFGINCDVETKSALDRAGAAADRVHLNDIIEKPALLDGYKIFAVPGGFSFGDDVASGRILANRLRYRLGGPIKKFIDDGKLAIGICNGFQVMVKMGILPLFDGEFRQEVTLTNNDSARFENRWVNLAVTPDTPCVWLKGISQIELPIRHGEGRFIPRNDDVLKKLQSNKQIAIRYAMPDGSPARGRFPQNPNGAVDDIAGICDPSGRVFGLMPHPEANTFGANHPQWFRQGVCGEGAGLGVFRNAVEFCKNR